jgi:CRP/FNR family transcriptional regulator, dissimilatory nitrate respiration regulator
MTASSKENLARRIMIADTLRRAPMFADVGPDRLRPIVEGCRLKSLGRGDFLFHEGEEAEGFYVVHQGAINVHRVTEEGTEQVIRVFYPGESLGEVVLVGDRTYPASAKATEPSQVILIPGRFFRQCIQADPDLALSILASMSLHLRFLVESVEALKLRQAESRVVQWFLRQWEERQLERAAEPTFELPLAKHLLASQLGITSETLSRVFAKLRKLGLLDVSGKTVRLHDVAVLREHLRHTEQD